MLVLISGPSGAGKSTFVGRLLEEDPRLEFSVSTTTRAIRGDEVQGREYHFVDDKEFDRLIAEDAFVEWANVHDHRYGTRRKHLQQMMDQQKIPLLDLDVQGGVRVSELFPDDVVSVFIFPPSWDVLRERLRGRGTDSDEVIATRLENARWEVGYAKNYEYFIINDDLEEAVARMRAIVTAEECRGRRHGQLPLQAENA